MLSPLLLGLAFFAYSGISGLIAVKDSKIFDQVTKAPLQIGDFEIQEIDSKTNKVKWTLNAINSESDLGQNQAQVQKPKLTFYNPSTGYDDAQFTITGEYAQFNKDEQEINLNDNVLLLSSDGKYILRCGHLKFQEQLPYLIVSDNWTLNSTDGYEVSGSKGLIKKDFSSIISQGNAKLTKGKQDPLEIQAEKITLEPNESQTIIAEKSAFFQINATTTLTAGKIIINQNGKIEAESTVNAKASNVNCFSDKLIITVDAKKKPLEAIFTVNPYIIQGDNTIYSDKIIYDFNTEKASIIGHVHSD
ncbi:MAG: LPS export ABC transporter periplasmic protein LptC [Cyanobacteria bacterium]|nr:LPS export ABC transporter periplasmic protein LptC [Cyanobacteriota bacterium]MDA1021195.1 LPS export ABC transporter periplasmic protein LptC [Cyanobacteriota bacterium]